MAEPPVRSRLLVQSGTSTLILWRPHQRRALTADPPWCNLGIDAGLHSACIGGHFVSHRDDYCRHSDGCDAGRDTGAGAADTGAPLESPYTSATLVLQRDLACNLLSLPQEERVWISFRLRRCLRRPNRAS